jgi:hypothetical protein
VLLVYDPASPNASSNPVEKGKKLDAVAAEIMKMASEAADVKSTTINIDPKWHAAIMGDNGTTLNALVHPSRSHSSIDVNVQDHWRGQDAVNQVWPSRWGRSRRRRHPRLQC